MVTKYVNIGLPEDLVKQIDKIIKKSEFGYKTRGEFVKEAVRNSVTKYVEIKRLK